MNYYELEPSENTFHTLLVDITHRCPLKCKNCYIPNRDIPDMDINKFYNLLSELPFRTDIRLMGGEATMRNDLYEIIENVRKFGHRPSILTAGLRLKRLEYCQGLWNSGLRSLGLSMNGGDDETLYELMDGHKKYTRPKLDALDNCFNVGFVTHINCIIGKGINEDLIKTLPELVTYYAEKNNRRFSKKYPIMIRFKNIGEIGDHIKDATISMRELADLFEKHHGISSDFILSQNEVDGYNECTSAIFSIKTRLGDLLIKLTDWKIDDEGIPDPNSNRRGRVTQDFKIAPFFEHVKKNEFEY